MEKNPQRSIFNPVFCVSWLTKGFVLLTFPFDLLPFPCLLLFRSTQHAALASTRPSALPFSH